MHFYISTPIFYVNAKPHLGHAYTSIIVDTFTRFHKLLGYDTYFMTGTDEHGDKIVEAAKKMNKTPEEYSAEISGLFKSTWPKLNVEYNAFLQTTEKKHKDTVSRFLDIVNNKGDIYFGEYGGYYCFGCERFYTEKEIENGFCPDHQTKLEYIAEENYFFRMENYQDWLIDYLKKHPDTIRPEQYRQEALSFLRDPLESLCISRPKSRLTWGIDLPFDDNFVTYVWFDALIIYLTALSWPDGEKYKKYWPYAQHTIAKDILKPHGIYWPTMLKSAGVPMYQHLNVHGYWQVDALKMSKTIGNVVEPLKMIETYGLDAFRYFLNREMNFGSDSNFTEEQLINRFNADLANDLGNLWQRTISMLGKFRGAQIPNKSSSLKDEDEFWTKTQKTIVAKYLAAFKNVAPHKAMAQAWELISVFNKFIDVEAPWALAKDDSKKEYLDGVFIRLLNGLAVIGALIWPAMPETGEELWRRLGLDGNNITLDIDKIRNSFQEGFEVSVGKTFFPRIEVKKTKNPAEKKEIKEIKTNGKDSNLIEFSEFQKLDIRVAEVIAAQEIKKSDRLLKLTIDLNNNDIRTVVAGIKEFYKAEDLIGKSIVVIANLKPNKIMGVESQAMILAAKDDNGLSFLMPHKPRNKGTKIS